MFPIKNNSSTFQRNTSQNTSNSSTRSNGHCRKNLKNKFDESREKSETEKEINSQNRIAFSSLNLNDTRKYIRNGAERLTKTFNTMRVSIETLSQRFKMSTKRRQILEEGPMTPNTQTPYTRSKQELGRTPTKLYSPFGIESPYNSTTIDKENLPSK